MASSAIAVSALNVGYAGLYPTVDTLRIEPNPTDPGIPFPTPNPEFVGNNTSTLTGIGISSMQPALSFAVSLGSKVFLGANVKMIYASTFVNTELVGSTSFDTFLDNVDRTTTRESKASMDAGIIVAPSENLNIGVVGRDLNSPVFSVQGLFPVRSSMTAPATVATQYMTKEIELKPQVRAGVSWKPVETLTLAADYDLTRNKTLTPGFEDQTLAVGLEQTVWSEYLNLRIGAYKNLADSRSNTVYTAGLGTRILAFRLDLAGAYDFDEREYQASLNLAIKF